MVIQRLTPRLLSRLRLQTRVLGGTPYTTGRKELLQTKANDKTTVVSVVTMKDTTLFSRDRSGMVASAVVTGCVPVLLGAWWATLALSCSQQEEEEEHAPRRCGRIRFSRDGRRFWDWQPIPFS
jgi:hypothetical protein